MVIEASTHDGPVSGVTASASTASEGALLWLSLLILSWLSCASCHVRVSHVAFTTYNGAFNLIVHASLGQLCLSLDANGLGTSQGNFLCT